MTIYIITDEISKQRWYYTSIAAALLDIENPLDISARTWGRAAATEGYPFTRDGVTVEKVKALTTEEVRRQNPPVV